MSRPITDAMLAMEHPLGCARNRDDHDCTCGLWDDVPARLEGYPPGHYKSWNGDIPDVERD